MMTAISTAVLNELASRRRIRKLWRLGPQPIAALLDRIQVERASGGVFDFNESKSKHRLHLAPAARQLRQARAA